MVMIIIGLFSYIIGIMTRSIELWYVSGNTPAFHLFPLHPYIECAHEGTLQKYSLVLVLLRILTLVGVHILAAINRCIQPFNCICGPCDWVPFCA